MVGGSCGRREEWDVLELLTTPSVPQYKVYYFSKKSNFSMFDQVYRQKYQYLEYQINTIRFPMMKNFIWYIFGIVDVDNFVKRTW